MKSLDGLGCVARIERTEGHRKHVLGIRKEGTAWNPLSSYDNIIKMELKRMWY
jgi:hypothetical protein